MSESDRLVPKLRFPEFLEEWSTKILGKCFPNIRNGFVGTATPYYVANGVPYLQGKNIKQGRIITNELIMISDDFHRKQVKSQLYMNDILMVQSGHVGECALVDKNYEGSNCHALIVMTPSEKVHSAFFVYYFYSPIGRKEIDRVKTGNTVAHILTSDLKPLQVFIPSLKEQQKIATCLSSLDELITAHTEKLEALKKHKKGLMQQLFPAEGETVPKLRSPKFQGREEWKFRILGDFITERSQIPLEKLQLFSLTIEDGVTPKTERYERSFLVKDEAEAYKLVCPNDFAYNPMNLRFGAIARYSGIENVALSKYYNIFFCDDTVDSRFCDVYFRSNRMITHYNNVATGTLIEKRRVHFSDFLKFNIRFPSFKEQQKIADCLTSLDERITAQTKKIAALKTHKKGLMQQLFPTMDETNQ